MNMDFNEFNFEVIDVVTGNEPELVINKNGVTLSLKLQEVLGYPTYIKPLIDAKNKAFALKVTKENDSNAIKVKSNKSEKKRAKILSCVAVRYTLRHVMEDEWKDNKRYRMIGIPYPKDRAVVFDLTKAEELDTYPTGNMGCHKKKEESDSMNCDSEPIGDDYGRLQTNREG